jgi:hypothetical protein
MIQVFSRSPIGHRFSIVQNEIESIHVIKGTNSHQILKGGRDIPFANDMEENVFNAIKLKYKDHIRFFGGKDASGRNIDAEIYTSKNVSDAKKKMNDSKPIIQPNNIATQTPGIEKLVDDGT